MLRLLQTMVVATFVVTSATQALAQRDRALVGLHDLRREGPSICIVNHFHLGTASQQPTRRAAQRAAMRDWSAFTAWEYGGHWGDPRRARNKSMACERQRTGWTCDFNARPCKVGRSRRARRR